MTSLTGPLASKNKPKIRLCLKCDQPFLSQWSGNRICPKCKQRFKKLFRTPEWELERCRGAKRRNGDVLV